MLSTARTLEVPDKRQILTSQLTTPTAADCLSSAPPCYLRSIKRQIDSKLS